jgi:hypothetical protein
VCGGHFPGVGWADGVRGVRLGRVQWRGGADRLPGLRAGQQLLVAGRVEQVQQLYGGVRDRQLPHGAVHAGSGHGVCPLRGADVRAFHALSDGRMHAYQLDAGLHGADGVRCE